MDPRLRVMSILEGCATLDDTETHLLTRTVRGIHLREMPLFSGRIASSSFFEIQGVNKPHGPEVNFDSGGCINMVMEEEAGGEDVKNFKRC